MKKHLKSKSRNWSYLAIAVGLAFLLGNPAFVKANTSGVQLHIQEQQAISLNQAGPEELQQIKGIGPVLAERIVDYRDQNGAFETKEGLMNVKGIGQLKFNKIKDSIQI